MLAVVPGSEAERAVDAVRGAGHDAWIVGEVVAGRGRAHVEAAGAV
ncbi:MAG: AIR synthase-related protein [Actinomycetota bacterium]